MIKNDEIVEVCRNSIKLARIESLENIVVSEIAETHPSKKLINFEDTNIKVIDDCYEGPCYTLFDENFEIMVDAVIKTKYEGFERITYEKGKTRIASHFQKNEMITNEFCYYVAQEQRDIYDWYFNILPRHYYAKQKGDGKLITLMNVQLDELELFNICENDLIRTQGYINKLRNCHLVKIPWMDRDKPPSQIVTDCYNHLRTKYMSPIRRKIYVSSGNFVNEGVFIEFLTKSGFDIIKGNQITKESICHISNCECLIVNDELWNIMICPNDCKVIQLSQNSIGKMICQIKGIKYTQFVSKTFININKIKALI